MPGKKTHVPSQAEPKHSTRIPSGPSAFTTSKRARNRSSRPSASSSKSNPPATTNPLPTAWAPSSPEVSKPLADTLACITPTTSPTACKSISPARDKLKPVLLLGHFDTVYPLGTLATMPCQVTDDRMHGPGVLDMKSGIALMLYAIAALQTWHGALPRPVTVFLVSDEEVGSYSSRKITEGLAKESSAVLVLEPAGPRGAVKTARKGVGEYVLNVNGVAAHAGLDPGKGHSAILELSRQIIAVSKLNDLQHGLSVNPGVIRGGTRTNVIAAEATAEIDVRIKHAKQAAALDRKLRALKPFDKHCKLSVEGGVNRMPMERTPGVAALYEKAQAIAKQVDWKLEEASVGGGSDGNFTAGMGIPTLDGLGGHGQGAHAVHEHIIISELPRRALLLAGMIEST